MDDLDSLWRYHEQVFRSFESQLGALIESHQKAEGRLDRLESNLDRLEGNLDRQGSNLDKLGLQIDKLQQYTQHAVELDIRAHRRERQRRRKQIEELEKQRAVDRAEWQERMERIERNLDRYLESLQGPNGRGRRAKGR